MKKARLALAQHLQLTARLHIFSPMKEVNSISEIKVAITKLLMATEDQALLAEIRARLHHAAGDDKNWFENLDAEDKASIARGEADIAAGRVHTTEEVMRAARRWGK